MRQNLEMLKFTITDFQMFYWGYALKINRRSTMTFEWRCYIYCLIRGRCGRDCIHGSWIYNYLCNRCLTPLMLWVRISIRARCTQLCDKVCQWFVAGLWFSPGTPVSSTNKTDCHDITEILFKVALNTTTLTLDDTYMSQ